MSHRRRLLNLVMANKFTGVCSLHHIDLHSPKNSLFYPTASAADQGEFDCNTLKTMKRIRPAAEPRLRFQSMPPPPGSIDSYLGRRFDCAALSESKTVFIDYHSRGGFIYDDDARCVVTLPTLRESKWFPILLAGASAGEEDENIIFVIGRTVYPAGHREDRFQFQALVHRKELHTSASYSYLNRWSCEELPPPPFVHDAGFTSSAVIGSYGMVGGGVYLSTEGVGTYCFDMASRTWSKAGDWALPFEEEIKHVPELGLLVGFPAWEEDQRLRALPMPWTVAEGGHWPPELCERWGDLHPPYAWTVVKPSRVISLGSGKLCAVQFFAKKRDSCSSCGHEDVGRRFAVFTGLEVVRAGEEGGGDDEPSGSGKDGIRVVRHKSKRYMLPDDDNVIIKSVL